MGVEFPDIMVDVETTGLSPDRSAILQIAAVKFNLEERTVCPEFFDRCMTIPPHRFWDQSTQSWWMKQSPEILKDIMSRQEPVHTVMTALQQWCVPKGTYRFWAKPTHFDYSIVDSYFKDAGILTPFSYRQATDMNSYLRGRIHPMDLNDLEYDVPAFVGQVHNGLDDTLHQLKVLFAMTEAIDALQN